MLFLIVFFLTSELNYRLTKSELKDFLILNLISEVKKTNFEFFTLASYGLNS